MSNNISKRFDLLEGTDPDTKNEAGFSAWTQDLEDQFRHFLQTEMFGNTYYCDEETRLKYGLKIIKKFVERNPEKAKEITISARNDYYMRTFPILASVFLSTKTDLEFLSSVIKTPRDALQFIDLARSDNIPARKGLGRKVKNALNKIFIQWIKTKGEFYATKYGNQLKTIARLTHPKIDSQIVDYLFGKDYDFEKLSVINAFEVLKKESDNMSVNEIIDLIQTFRLDWNTLKGSLKITPEIWRHFYKNMSMIAKIKNIVSTERHLGYDETFALVRDTITRENLQKGKVLPYRLMQAYAMTQDADTKRHLGIVANDYARHYDLSNLGKVLIAPDISGSMTDMANRNFTYAELAGMFSGILARACKDSILCPWGTRNYAWEFPLQDNSWRDVAKLYEYCKYAIDGGTNMDIPVNFLIEHNLKVDTLVLLTDTMEWAGSGWIHPWKQYLKKFNRNAKAFLVRTDSYINTQPYPPEIAVPANIYQMYGYSDYVFKIMTTI